MKKQLFLCFSALILILALSFASFASGRHGDPYQLDEITFSVDYEGDYPSPETTTVKCETPHVYADNIRTNIDKKLISVDFHVDDGAYTLPITKKANVKILTFRSASSLKYYSAYRYNNITALRVYMTWGDLPEKVQSYWVADEYGLRHIDLITDTPTIWENNNYTNEQFFDENGYLQRSVFVNKWRQYGDYYVYFDENGYLLRNTMTPDGYYVDSRGIYIPEATPTQ